jgi:flagellin-like hook-associated protein FlgL
MGLDSISLTPGMSNNLINLQHTAQLTAQIQERLATGKKVNLSLDNPVEFFTSQNMLDQTTDLTSLSIC